MGECCLHVFFPELCLCNLLNFEDKNRVERVFAILFAVDHQGLPMTRFGQSFGKEITVVNLCTNWWTTYFEVLSTQQFLGFFKKGSWPRRWFPFQNGDWWFIGTKTKDLTYKPELVNWLCVAHERVCLLFDLMLFWRWMIVIGFWQGEWTLTVFDGNVP